MPGLSLEDRAGQVKRGLWSYAEPFQTALAALTWGIAPFPSAWNALSDEDKAWMLQTYISREQMRSVDADEAERAARRANRKA